MFSAGIVAGTREKVGVGPSGFRIVDLVENSLKPAVLQGRDQIRELALAVGGNQLIALTRGELAAIGRRHA
jgi:hypothetical protein